MQRECLFSKILMHFFTLKNLIYMDEWKPHILPATEYN